MESVLVQANMGLLLHEVSMCLARHEETARRWSLTLLTIWIVDCCGC